MLCLIRHADVFAPEPMGVQDLLVGGGRILEVGPRIRMPKAHCRVVDSRGLLAVPGFIDGHVHLV